MFCVIIVASFIITVVTSQKLTMHYSLPPLKNNYGCDNGHSQITFLIDTQKTSKTVWKSLSGYILRIHHNT